MSRKPPELALAELRLEKAHALLREKAWCDRTLSLYQDCPDSATSKSYWCWGCRAKAYLEEHGQ